MIKVAKCWKEKYREWKGAIGAHWKAHLTKRSSSCPFSLLLSTSWKRFWNVQRRTKVTFFSIEKLKYYIHCWLMKFIVPYVIRIFFRIVPYGMIIRKDEQWEGTVSCVTFTASQIKFIINISYNFLYYRVIYLYITSLLLILKKMLDKD